MQNHQYRDTDSAGPGQPWRGDGGLGAALAGASSQARAHLPFDVSALKSGCSWDTHIWGVPGLAEPCSGCAEQESCP